MAIGVAIGVMHGENSRIASSGISRPGDCVDLRAEMDVLVALSNCPQMNNPANDYNPTPIRVEVRSKGRLD